MSTATGAVGDASGVHPDESSLAMSQADQVTRARILDSPATVFTEYGFSGTKLSAVAAAAGVSPATVRRLVGGRNVLFKEVMAARVLSQGAGRIAAAAVLPQEAPPTEVVLTAAREVFAGPEGGWDILELEALARSRVDESLRDIETDRMRQRLANIAALVAQMRENGAIDRTVPDAAVTHLILALSAGIALLDPVTDAKPDTDDWMALMSRISQAFGTNLSGGIGYGGGDRFSPKSDCQDRDN